MRCDHLIPLRRIGRLCRGPAVGTLVSAALLCALAGCAQPPTEAASSAIKTQPTIEPRDPALALLDYAHHVATISPEARVSAVKTARADVHKAPSAAAYARLAIALGTPSQKLYTPDEAARYARLALETQPSPWNTAARQYLADYARLYTRLTADSNGPGTDAATAAEVRRLQSKLDEAHNKLKALAHIEERLDSKDRSH